MLPLSCHDPHSTANAACRVPSRVMAEARASLTRTRSLPAHGTVTPGARAVSGKRYGASRGAVCALDRAPAALRAAAPQASLFLPGRPGVACGQEAVVPRGSSESGHAPL